jgi:V/A-type H+-transporting ATPase subunit E
MGLEEVLQAILDRGKAEADAIVEAAKKERETLLAEAEEEGRRLRAEREDAAREDAKRREVQELARAELESKKIVLGAQREVLEEVRKVSLTRLRDLPENEDVLRRLLQKYAADWEAGKVYCAASDQEVVRAVVGTRFAGTVDCVGGLVIENEDASTKLDLRYETILDEIWTNHIREIAGVLWPETQP